VIADLFQVLVWLAWIGMMAGLLIWAIADFRRTHTWYVAILAAGAALHLVYLACMMVDPRSIPRVPGLPAPSRSLERVLWRLFQDLGGWAFALSTLLLIIGGLAFYVAYPRLDEPGVGPDGKPNGGDG
jgi:hypothetical protein